MADCYSIVCPTCGTVLALPPSHARRFKYCSIACRVPNKSDSLTAGRLRELLEYDKNTGVFRWKVRRGSSIKPGSVAGSDDGIGYIRIRIDWKKYKAHRLAWLYVHGKWPDEFIDHINGVKSDNRIINLRDVSNQMNVQNVKKARANSKSGILGVKPVRGTSKWSAVINASGVRTVIGSFYSKEDAGVAYLEAKAKLHIGVM